MDSRFNPPRRASDVSFNGATFAILIDGDEGGYPGWAIETFTSRRHVPASNRNYLFAMGVGTATIALTIWCDDETEYDTLQTKLLTTGRLTLIAGLQGQRGTKRHKLGVDYEDLDGVTLTAITDEQFFTDGHVEATIQLVRAGSTT